MPRRKEQKIALSQLERCTEVYLSLKEDPIFDGYDLSTLTISVKAKITPVIENAQRAATNLEYYLAANPSCCEEFEGVKYVTKQRLSKMINISRATLDKWLNDGSITPTRIDEQGKIEIYDPYDILNQLKKRR